MIVGSTTERYVFGLACAAGLGVATAVGLLVGTGAAWSLASIAWFAALPIAYAYLQRHGFVLHWREHRAMSTLDEPVVFLALLVLPFPSAPLVVFLGALIVQIVAKRAALKATFNIAAYSTAAVVASAAFIGLTELVGVAPLIAALPAVAAYTVTSNVLVAEVFARNERASFLQVFRERFALSTAVYGPLGASFGLIAYILSDYHPLALIATLPLLMLLRAFPKLDASAQREGVVRRRLAGMANELIGNPHDEQVAKLVLDACGDLFLAGRASMTLTGKGGSADRTWTRDFEGGASSSPPLETPIVGLDGTPIGVLRLHGSNRARGLVDASDEPLLRIVAARVASAIETARAIRETLRHQSLHEGIVENVPAGVARVALDGTILQANPFLLSALHVDAPPRDGQNVFAWAPLLPLTELLALVRSALAGEPFFDHEVTVAGATLTVSGVPLRSTPASAVEGAILLFSDVSARKQAEEALRSQSLARPFVRRLVLNIASGLQVPPASIAAVGRSLARELPRGTLDDYVHAFRAMGLGNLQFERQEGDKYVFRADDLLERRPKSPQPTCHLARGFLEGAVAALHTSSSLGSELHCQSQGHSRCTFVVQPRAEIEEAKSNAGEQGTQGDRALVPAGRAGTSTMKQARPPAG